MLSLSLALSLIAPQPTGQDLKIQPYAQVKFEAIDEMSGIAKSRRFADTYWVHNDSGDVARIFAIHRNGDVIVPPKYNRKEDAGKEQKQKAYEGIKINGAGNLDWEDIAIDGDTLYISETGNNYNFRRDLCVYVVTEPNPALAEETHVLKRIPVAYPDQTEFPPKGGWNFDCEALAASKGKLYFVTKWRAGSNGMPADGAAIYVLDKPSTDKINVLKKLDVNTAMGGWVTAADISPDGKTLAVLVQAPKQSVWFFDMTKGSKILSHPVGRVVFKDAKQCEAVCWDSASKLIVTNEQRDMYEINFKK